MFEQLKEVKERLEEIVRQLSAPECAKDPARLQSIADSLEKSRQRLDEAYEKWLELQD